MMNACDRPIQVHASTSSSSVFCVSIKDICKFMLFLAFPFAVKLVYKYKVWCASKPETVDNPAAVIHVYIARLYMTRTIYGSSAFGNNISTSNAFVRTASQKNEKPMIIIIISVCSQMITYKAVKANSWLQY